MIKPYQDPKHPYNGSEYHTGKECIEPGCHNPAGTAWSPFWCFDCNVKRIDRISRQLDEIAERYEGEERWG